jgi:hypothetical protein
MQPPAAPATKRTRLAAAHTHTHRACGSLLLASPPAPSTPQNHAAWQPLSSSRSAALRPGPWLSHTSAPLARGVGVTRHATRASASNDSIASGPAGAVAWAHTVSEKAALQCVAPPPPKHTSQPQPRPRAEAHLRPRCACRRRPRARAPGWRARVAPRSPRTTCPPQQPGRAQTGPAQSRATAALPTPTPQTRPTPAAAAMRHCRRPGQLQRPLRPAAPAARRPRWAADWRRQRPAPRCPAPPRRAAQPACAPWPTRAAAAPPVPATAAGAAPAARAS